MKKLFCSFLMLAALAGPAGRAQACDSCSCALSRAGGEHGAEGKGWFFDTTVEGIDWDSRGARDAHELHHEGHHTHNKTHEEFYHFSLGVEAMDELTILAELPYVVRHATEIDSHAALGQKQTSEGLGDMKLTAMYHLWHRGNDFIGPVAGIKLPTGSTGEKKPDGSLFEAEMQPGSGSTDWSIGGAFQKDLHPFVLHGNVLYAFRNEGDHDFRYGDLFSSYLYLDTPVAPNVWLGVDMNFQAEGKHEEEGLKNPDSGGITLMMGPSLKVQAHENVSVLANFLLPAAQDLGGVHQEQDFMWNLSARIAW